MVNKPIKLQDNLSLYSGDIITIDNSNPLLVEITIDNKVKLRNIKDNKYLSKKLFSLNFSADFEDALTFTIKQNSSDKISLRTNDNKYLKLDGKNFHLSSKEKLLTITRPQITENIANFEETMEVISLHKEKTKKINNEKLLIAHKSYDNKTDNSLEYLFEFTESVRSEHNFTWSTDFTLGASTKLSCSSVIGIDIGGQIEKKSSNSNSVTKTGTKTFKESLKINCLPWKKTHVKWSTEKVELLTPYTANVRRVINGRIYEYSIAGEYLSDSYSEVSCLTETITVRNILIVGWTGSGKSTLAKVLSESNDFIESNKSTPGTKFYKKGGEFEWEGNYYCVIDNIGFGDTKLAEKEVLMRIGEAINSSYQGLSHVLFVFGGRFSDQEKEGFHNLATLKITNSYITVIRSRFENFDNEGECEKDKESLVRESPEIGQLFDNCRGLLHIDNDDEYSRDGSRTKVLNHLHNSCTNVPFKPKEWDDISSLIENYFKEKVKLENKIEANINQEAEIKQQLVDLETNTAEQVKEKSQTEEISDFFELAQVEINTK